jgi:hypothetical protein
MDETRFRDFVARGQAAQKAVDEAGERPELAERLAKFMWRRTLPSLGSWEHASKERKALMLHEARAILAWLAAQNS